MELIEHTEGDITVVEPRGRIDSATAKEFGDRLSKLLNNGRTHLVIDLHSITYISGAGFHQLLIAKRSMQDRDGRLALCGVSGEIKRLFDIGSFGELLPIYPTRESGIAGMQ